MSLNMHYLTRKQLYRGNGDTVICICVMCGVYESVKGESTVKCYSKTELHSHKEVNNNSTYRLKTWQWCVSFDFSDTHLKYSSWAPWVRFLRWPLFQNVSHFYFHWDTSSLTRLSFHTTMALYDWCISFIYFYFSFKIFTNYWFWNRIRVCWMDNR